MLTLAMQCNLRTLLGLFFIDLFIQEWKQQHFNRLLRNCYGRSLDKSSVSSSYNSFLESNGITLNPVLINGSKTNKCNSSLVDSCKELIPL